MTCEKCDNGWVTVRPSYAANLVPEPELPEAEGPEWDEIRAEMVADFERRRREAETHVYPCRICKPTLFFRWVERHYEPGHDAEGCADCIELRKGRRRSTSRTLADPTPPPDLPERKDLL